MEIRKLNEIFYNENKHLVEVLDKSGTSWTGDKTRGYGVVLVDIVGLRFGIPLRSGAKHSQCYKFFNDNSLDYSKAVLLTKDEYVSEVPFMIPNEQFISIKSKAYFITQKFNKYVERYINAIKKDDKNALRVYAYSTLQNYHTELGI
ncbi:type III toxin-antitoxin system TenpIN family toxin (plasmid) [Serratia fonticola]|uniref:type III toxin-antitoxin system TenpIN family toxin n=1 Tax=Serratia fonticola TaxID=47917 RepID=UPI003AF3664E